MNAQEYNWYLSQLGIELYGVQPSIQKQWGYAITPALYNPPLMVVHRLLTSASQIKMLAGMLSVLGQAEQFSKVELFESPLEHERLLSDLKRYAPSHLLILGEETCRRLAIEWDTARQTMSDWQGFSCFITYEPSELEAKPQLRRDAYDELLRIKEHRR